MTFPAVLPQRHHITETSGVCYHVFFVLLVNELYIIRILGTCMYYYWFPLNTFLRLLS